MGLLSSQQRWQQPQSHRKQKQITHSCQHREGGLCNEACADVGASAKVWGLVTSPIEDSAPIQISLSYTGDIQLFHVPRPTA